VQTSGSETRYLAKGTGRCASAGDSAARTTKRNLKNKRKNNNFAQ